MNARQERFCLEYLVDCNGKQAAIRAGYAPLNAEVTASQLLRKPKVSEYLKAKSQTIADKLGVSAEYVLASTKALHENSKPLVHKSNPEVAMKSLSYLGKYLKLWDNDDKKQTQNLTIQIVQF